MKISVLASVLLFCAPLSSQVKHHGKGDLSFMVGEKPHIGKPLNMSIGFGYNAVQPFWLMLSPTVFIKMPICKVTIYVTPYLILYAPKAFVTLNIPNDKSLIGKNIKAQFFGFQFIPISCKTLTTTDAVQITFMK